jgi:hypothetical protein
MTSVTRLGPAGYPIAAKRSAAQTLQLAGGASRTAFGAPALQPGGISLSLAGFAAADAFGVPELSAGAVTVTPAGFAGTSAFGAPQLSLKLQLVGLAGAAGFGAPVLQPGAITLTLRGVAAADAFGVPALSVGAATVSLAGIANVSRVGAPQLVPAAVTLSPAGFAGASGFGALSLQIKMQLSGFADGERFGAPVLSSAPVTLALSGFADADRFGAATLVPGAITVQPRGFGDADAFGVPVLQQKKRAGQGGGGNPGGVGAAQKYATRVVMSEAGLIVALEAQSSVAKALNSRMALYADAIGSPGALIAQSVDKTSVVIGSNSYALIVPRSVAAGTAVWVAFHTDGNFNWFLSAGPTSRFNADAFADGPSDPFGASTLSNNKAPVFVVYLEAVTLELRTAGLADADRLGAPRLIAAAPQTLAPIGFAGKAAFGGLELRPASATISLSGFADGEAFGSTALQQASRLSLAGFGNADRFGAPTLQRAEVPVTRPETTAANGVHRIRTLRNSVHRARVLSNPIGDLRRLLKRTRRRQSQNEGV